MLLFNERETHEGTGGEERHGWMEGSIRVRKTKWVAGQTHKGETAMGKRIKIMRGKRVQKSGKDKEIITA